MNTRPATARMLDFARDIANAFDLELPTRTDANGNEVADESFDAIHDFIEENKDDFYEWKREEGSVLVAALGALVALIVAATVAATLLLFASIMLGRPLI